jgi:anthranilate synthase component 1
VKRGPSYAVEREFAKADFEAAVQKAKDYIAAGDCMQIVIGQRLQALHRKPAEPVPRAALAQPQPLHVLLRHGGLPDRRLLARDPGAPRAHARGREGHHPPDRRHAPARATPEADKALEAELLADPKERAEHVMLIDLARNDVGRIAKTGSVKVTEAFAIERYSHVMHIVSNVEGLLKDGMSNLDVLKASFPAGTLSGAPKIRAMEIIDELEPVQRGIYGGACGYLSFAGDMDVAIVIRTGIVKNQTLYVQAAAGVVADSVPEMEWRETEVKARALIRAAELVEEGF